MSEGSTWIKYNSTSSDADVYTDIKLETLSKEVLLSLVIKCANFAAIKHQDQRRQNMERTPYINHPLGVANILIEEGNVHDPVVILAALLHDTVEDTDTTFQELENEFGKHVCNVVKEVTDDKTLSKAERKHLQILNAPGKSYEAKLVALADKLYNLRDILKGPPIGWSHIRVKEYFEWAADVVNGYRGTNTNLEKALDVVFATYFGRDNVSWTNRSKTTISSSTMYKL